VNDVPHIGHAYTTIMADVIKRHKKLQGYDVFFLTGTDEHGQKIEKSAREKQITPQELADRMVMHFKNLWQALNIEYDKFIRTTDDYHIAGVNKIFKRAMDKGDIYPGEYKGHYCISCESFVAPAVDDEEADRECPDCGKFTSMVSETCYFFRLSAYQDRLLTFYRDNPTFILPQTRMNEVTSFVKMGLRDLSVTRSTVKWGIPVPGDEEQTIYVWFDALSNYINAVNYHNEDETFKRLWPADLHIMGKDILKFHAVYWPAFLMAADLPLPTQELIHGWWLQDEKKMSKSTGNVLDPQILLKHFNADAIRYFMMREASIGADGNFSHQGLITRINTDLANDWGNLVSRTSGMIGKYFANQLHQKAQYSAREEEVKSQYKALEKKVMAHYDNFRYNRGLEKISEYINFLNRYIVNTEPWTLAKDEDKQNQLAAVLKTLVRAILSVNTLLSPVIPESAEKINHIFNHKSLKLGWCDISEEISVSPAREQLFPRVDPKDFFADETKKEAKVETKAEGLITFDEFKKVEMVVAKVLAAEKVEKADKLLQLKVDTGTDQRTLVAGVAEYYQPEDLAGKKILMVKNLQPAKIRGILSQGMILAASGSDNRPFIPVIPEETPIGSRLI
jgi:methionyl-tRNA synthetase